MAIVNFKQLVSTLIVRVNEFDIQLIFEIERKRQKRHVSEAVAGCRRSCLFKIIYCLYFKHRFHYLRILSYYSMLKDERNTLFL